MARTHARILVSIWSDPDFTALSHVAQWLYVTVLSQPTLTFAGVVPYTPRRWASYAPTLSVESIEDAIAELTAERFVLVDLDTEEVMVRSFLRHDGVLNSPNVLKAAVRDWHQIVSPALRAAVIAEVPTHLQELFTEPFGEPFREGFPEGLPEPSRKGSGNGTGNGSGKVLAGARVKTPSPSPSPSPTPTPKHTAPRKRRGTPPPAGHDPSVCVPDDGFTRLWDTWPDGRRSRRNDALAAWTAATANGATAEQILTGLQPWLTYWAQIEPRYVPRPDTWLSKGDWTTTPPRRRASKANQVLDVVNQVIAEEEGT